MTIHKQLMIGSMMMLASGMVIAGLLGFSLLSQHQQQVAATAAAPTPAAIAAQASTPASEAAQGRPRHISVPSLGIDTQIEDGYYNAADGSWNITEDTAFYATPTLPANSSGGNTLIYGHNSKKIFGNLLHITIGTEAIVTTGNGYEFVYEFQSTEAVKPTDTASLAYTGAPRLTLQTCSGAWNETRQLVYFSLKSYRKL